MPQTQIDIAPDDAVVVSVGLCGHGMVRVSSPDGADVTLLDSKGNVTGYEKRISDIYGFDIRSAKRMTGRCRALLYSGTVETKCDEKPVVPTAAILAARVYEACRSSVKVKTGSRARCALPQACGIENLTVSKRRDGVYAAAPAVALAVFSQ